MTKHSVETVAQALREVTEDLSAEHGRAWTAEDAYVEVALFSREQVEAFVADGRPTGWLVVWEANDDPSDTLTKALRLV